MPHQPNIIVLLADQLRAASVPLYGEIDPYAQTWSASRTRA